MPEAVRDILRRAGWTEQRRRGPRRGRERWDALQALVALADALAAAPPTGGGQPTVADLVAELDERAAAQHAPTVEGVTLASLHAAKGLEWDAVFLVGLSRGAAADASQAQTDAAVAEERRLLYVGVTRAREHLAAVVLARPAPARPGHARRVALPHRPLARTSAAARPVPRRELRRPPRRTWSDRLTVWRDDHAAEVASPAGVGADDGDHPGRSPSAARRRSRSSARCAGSGRRCWPASARTSWRRVRAALRAPAR